MAGAAFPLAKLGFLIVRQASRPIANSITRRARASTIFRDWICVPTAQAFHWCDVKVPQNTDKKRYSLFLLSLDKKEPCNGQRITALNTIFFLDR